MLAHVSDRKGCRRSLSEGATPGSCDRERGTNPGWERGRAMGWLEVGSHCFQEDRIAH